MTDMPHLSGARTTGIEIVVVAHSELTAEVEGGLRGLFDAEYGQDFGGWDPELPYGYAPHDVHVVARQGRRIVGHVGWARRTIGVGVHEIVIAGVGGVLVSDDVRGQRCGERLMSRAASTMSDAGGIDFGYLGCREEVVEFYRSCGWVRISAAERSTGRAGQAVSDPPGQPLLVHPIEASLTSWPDGDIDLRGRAW